MKFQYLAGSSDRGAAGAVTAEFIASRIANKSIGAIAIAESGMGFGFSLSDGGHVKFRLTQNGTAEIVYYAPSSK